MKYSQIICILILLISMCLLLPVYIKFISCQHSTLSSAIIWMSTNDHTNITNTTTKVNNTQEIMTYFASQFDKYDDSYGCIKPLPNQQISKDNDVFILIIFSCMLQFFTVIVIWVTAIWVQ